MNEKRIQELAERWWGDDRITILDFIPIVAAEARNEAIDEVIQLLLKRGALSMGDEQAIHALKRG